MGNIINTSLNFFINKSLNLFINTYDILIDFKKRLFMPKNQKPIIISVSLNTDEDAKNEENNTGNNNNNEDKKYDEDSADLIKSDDSIDSDNCYYTYGKTQQNN